MKKHFLILPVLCLLLTSYQAHAQGNTTGTSAPAGTPGNPNNTSRGQDGSTSTGEAVNNPSDIAPAAGDNSMAGTPDNPNNTSRAQDGTTESGMPSNMNNRQFNTFATRRWDRNGDGTISKSEWSAVGSSWFGNGRARSFNSLDTNNNGVINSTELQTYLSNSQMYQSYDTNGDGVIDNTESTRIPAQ